MRMGAPVEMGGMVEIVVVVAACCLQPMRSMPMAALRCNLLPVPLMGGGASSPFSALPGVLTDAWPRPGAATCRALQALRCGHRL